jgi:hypothetical protein
MSDAFSALSDAVERRTIQIGRLVFRLRRASVALRDAIDALEAHGLGDLHELARRDAGQKFDTGRERQRRPAHAGQDL